MHRRADCSARGLLVGLGARYALAHDFHQLWVPLYATTVLFALFAEGAAPLPRPSAIARPKVLWVVLLALASAYFAQVSLGHNRAQMRHSATERALFDAMAQVMSREPDVKFFVVRLEPDAAWMSVDAPQLLLRKHVVPKPRGDAAHHPVSALADTRMDVLVACRIRVG